MIKFLHIYPWCTSNKLLFLLITLKTMEALLRIVLVVDAPLPIVNEGAAHGVVMAEAKIATLLTVGVFPRTLFLSRIKCLTIFIL